MDLTRFSLREYTGLLDKLGQLAAPVPDGVDLERTVEPEAFDNGSSE